jgi:predicted dienelactone hydrolase
MSPATYANPSLSTQDPFLPLPQYASAWSRRWDLEGARALFLVMVTIPRPSVVFTALRCLSISLAEEMWEVRTILAWMGVEALFAPPREKKPATAPLLARLRYYLGKVAPARWFSLKDLAHLYAERSDIVHGARFGKVTSAKSLRTTYQSERVLSLALRAVLGDPKEVSALCGPDREKHLSAIQEPRPSPRGRAWSR